MAKLLLTSGAAAPARNPAFVAAQRAAVAAARQQSIDNLLAQVRAVTHTTFAKGV